MIYLAEFLLLTHLSCFPYSVIISHALWSWFCFAMGDSRRRKRKSCPKEGGTQEAVLRLAKSKEGAADLQPSCGQNSLPLPYVCALKRLSNSC